jgi:hypothetical protein
VVSSAVIASPTIIESYVLVVVTVLTPSSVVVALVKVETWSVSVEVDVIGLADVIDVVDVANVVDEAVDVVVEDSPGSATDVPSECTVIKAESEYPSGSINADVPVISENNVQFPAMLSFPTLPYVTPTQTLSRHDAMQSEKVSDGADETMVPAYGVSHCIWKVDPLGLT